MSDRVVYPNLKNDPGPCPCGCGVEGTPRTRAWKDGLRHVRTCKCSRCRGAKNRRQGLRKQNQARKALGVPVDKFGSSNEERWASMFGDEVKSGAQVGPLFTWWRKVEKQVRANEADFGDDRKPVRAIAMPEGWNDGIVAVRLSTWNELIGPALEEFYGEGEIA